LLPRRLLAATAALALAATTAACSSSRSADTASAKQNTVTLTLGDQVNTLKTLLTASGVLSGA
jgi:predicted component of type VI protein secretion system